MSVPTYVICRDSLPGQPVDPTAQLVFWPPKDSDELFDALRMKYPHLRTHSERMREAVIGYLVQEQQVPQLPAEQFPTPTTANSTLTSPWEASMQSMSSGSSTLSSPELFDLATPSFSPQPQAQPLSRQQSVATTAAAPTTSTPPAIEQMTGVFSLSDASQPKQRVRRKMTEVEKIEYRKRRIVKACEKCSKRKRKCNHNHPDMETVGSSKVTKPSPTGTTKKPPHLATPHIQEENTLFGANTLNFDSSFGSDMSMPELTDYSTLFDDTLQDMNLDDLFMPTEQQWPWSETGDWTLMDSSTESLYDVNRAPQLNVPQQVPGGSWFDQDIGGSDEMFNHDMMQITGGGNHKTMLWEHLRTGQEDPTEKQQPTHTLNAHELDELDKKKVPQPRQTQWLHEIDEKEAFEYDADYAAPSHDWNQAGIPSNQNWPQHGIPTEDVSAKSSLSQMTLRLTGTRKAVKAFGSLLPSSSSRKKSRIQSVSLKNVALLALGGFSMAQDLQNHRIDGVQPLPCPITSCAAGGQSFSQTDLRKHMDGHTIGHDPQGEPLIRTPLEVWRSVRKVAKSGMTTEDYLRMHTNTTPVQEDGRERVSRTQSQLNRSNDPDATSIASVSARALADVERSVKSKIRNPNPDSESVEVKMHEHRDSAAQQGRKVSSLGAGLTTTASPATELYLLKRRIPNALHSVVDRNSPLGPLLMTIPEDVDTYSQRDHERETVISRNSECTEGNKILATGTTWLTLDTVNCSTGGSGAALSSAQPVHTRPVHLSSSGYEGDTTRHHVAALDRTTAIAANTARVPSPLATLAAGESYGRAVQFGSAPISSPTVNLVEAYRLSDHVRRRDHFGRHRSNLASGLMFSLAAFATLILLSFVQTSPATLSLLLLALVAPVRGTKESGRSMPSVSNDWVPALRDIIENSSWQTAFQSFIRHFNPAGNSANVQRVLYYGRDSYWQIRSEAQGVVV